MVAPAEARHRHHFHRSYGPAELADRTPFPLPEARRYDERKANLPRAATVTALVPPTWKEEPATENWDGKRYLSPDGMSWIAIYKAPADGEQVSDHLRDVIFAPNETITYLHGERTWVAVSGFKGDRIVYRKALLACEGKEWHHIAFEYPIELKERLDPMVTATARALDGTVANCGRPVAKQ